MSALVFTLASPELRAGPARISSSRPPSFGYDLSISPEKYRLAIRMAFSPDVSLAQAVAAFRNGELLHELNPDADPVRTLPLRDGSYGTIMTWHAFGLTTGQLASCHESSGGPESWSRRCDVRTEAMGAGRYTAWKWDEVTCDRSAGGGLRCVLEIQGKLKDFLFMKSSVLTLKAKRQALINWGRFWYLLENGGVSTRFSNPLFDRSALKADIERLLREGLPAAKAEPSSFRFTRKGEFYAATGR